MTPLQIAFLLIALVTFLASVMVVTSPRIVHAGLWLILALAGVAGVFVLLEASFLAVIQVVVYIGAIAILIIFAAMVTRRVMRVVEPQANNTWWLAAIVALVLFTGLAVLALQVPTFQTTAPALTADQNALLVELGRALVDVNAYVLPFEMASILLLAAMVGAIIIARPPEGPGE